MKASAPLLGSLALTAAIVLMGWTGCRSGTTEKPEPLPALKPVNSPVPATAYAAVTPPPATNPAVATTPTTATASPGAPASPPASPMTEPPAKPSGASDAAPTAKVPPQPPELTPGVQAVVDMVHSQVETAVLLEYVKNSTQTFELDSDDIVYLKDIGVPDEVVTAMLKRTSELQAPPAAGETENAPPAPAAEAAAAAPAPAPQSTYDNTVTATAPAPPPSAPVTENYFYSSLSPYGTWLYIEPYGWCWQPTVAVADRSWRPYLHGGRWVYTTAGWYWQSYYSWGWAPFHYGNWFVSPACGWVWVPGCTWGPAWVTWRYSDAYCGWAPLPPGCVWTPGIGLTYWGSGVSFSFGFSLGWNSYAFCGWNDWWRPYPYRYCLPPYRAAVVYNQTTIINNYYIDKSHNTIINEGVPPNAMPAHVRKELRKVELADVPAAGNSRNLRPERTAPDGSKLAVYRPQVPPDLKVASARPGAAPYRPVRSRSESPTLTRGNFAPERNLTTAPSRMERPESGLPRPPQRATAPGRSESPARAEVPGRAPSASVPSRTTPERTPAATVPGRTAPERTPAVTVPSRTEPRAAQPGAPSRTEPRVQGTPTPSRTFNPGWATPSRRAEPSAATVPDRSTAPAGAPVAPGRSGSRQLETQPAQPPTGRAPLSVPPSRYQAVPGAPPSRGEAWPALPGANSAPRYAPPSRVPAPEYRSGSPSGPRISGAPPARTPIPSAPGISPGRSAPSSPPGFSQPAAPRGFSSPPAVSSPPARSSGAGNAPSFGGESGGRPAPAGPAPSRSFRPQ